MKQCKQAFTLIELLVVICIIAILASMLLPALQSARESASVATCVSNLGQMSKAFQMYATNFNDFMPALTPTQAGSGSTGWENALIDALGQNRNNSPFRSSFFCDADSSSDNPGSNKKSYSLNNLQHAVHPVIDFSIDGTGKVDTKGKDKGYISGNKTTSVYAASSLIVIGENVSESNTIGGAATFSATDKECNSPNSSSAVHQQVSIVKRHTSHTTAGELYLDGHAKHVKPQVTLPSAAARSLATQTTYCETVGTISKAASEGWGDWSDCFKRKQGTTCSGTVDANGRHCHSKN